MSGLLVIAFLAAGTASCGLTREIRQGQFVSDAQAELIVPGISREQVFVLLGTPSIKSDFDPDRVTFLYVSQKRRKTAFLNPRLVEQEVFAVFFDQQNRVLKSGRFKVKGGKIGSVLNRETEGPGSVDISLVEGLLGGAILSPISR